MIRLELPFPVPQHLIHVKGRGRVPTRRYRAYLGDFKAAISRQQPRALKGPVAVYVRLSDGQAGAAADLGTCILDTLKAHGLIDGRLRLKSFEWAEDGPGCVVLIQQEVAA